MKAFIGGLPSSKGIAPRLVFNIILFSSFFTLLITSLQLYLDYKQYMKEVDRLFLQIERSYLPSFQNSLWIENEKQVKVLLQGILQLSYVESASVDWADSNLVLRVGSKKAVRFDKRSYLIQYTQDEKKFLLGSLEVVANLDEVVQHLIDKLLFLLPSQAIKTFAVSAFILWMFNQLVLRHLKSIEEHCKNLVLETLPQDLTLERSAPEEADELDEVVQSLNRMQDTLFLETQKKEEAQNKALEDQRIWSEQLEIKVEERSSMLKQLLKFQEEQNQKLQEQHLKVEKQQEQLIESEKLASLGSLVAGVAHEINTPVGISLTSASYLSGCSQSIKEDLKKGELSEHSLEEFLEELDEASELIVRNLERTAELVNSFKKVASDQSSGEKREFSLYECLRDVANSLRHELKRGRHTLSIQCAESLKLNDYPGYFIQIYSNLIMNSIAHGFKNQRQGKIAIEITQEEKSLELLYSDDGKGMNSEEVKHVFDPFYTTNRGSGNIGLGMNIVYNIVVGKLGGSIRCRSNPNEGARFKIVLPLKQMKT